MKRKGGDLRENPRFEKSDKMSGAGYIADPKLLPRVQQYLAAQKGKRHISISSMADDLQARYGEYGRKKKNAFRQSVTKAYDVICSQNKKGKSDSASDLEKNYLEKRRKMEPDSDSAGDSEASLSDDNPDYVQVKDSNSMNSFMTNLYKKPKPLAGLGVVSTPRTTPSSPSHPGSGSSTPMPGSPCRKSCPNSPQPWYADKEEDDATLFTIDRKGNTEVLKQNPVTSANKLAAAAVKKSQSPKPKLKVFQDQTTRSPLPKVKTSDSTPGKNPEGKMESGVQGTSDVVPADNVAATGKTTKKVRKKTSDKEGKKKGPEVQQSAVKFADVGGNEATLKEVCQLLVHLKHPEVYQALGVTPPRGFLLHGPPGCGKTLLANAIAGELELPFIKMAATEIVSGVSGESEEKLRDVFDKAIASAPCILFLDEIDAITQKRETASKDMERRIVSQLLTCMDDLNTKSLAHVLVIGATNRPDSLDPALRRAGRFDREISLGIPDEQARKRILQVLCRELSLSSDFDFLRLARLTPGFVGADLMALSREAAIGAVNRVFHALQGSSQVASDGGGDGKQESATLATSCPNNEQLPQNTLEQKLQEPEQQQQSELLPVLQAQHLSGDMIQSSPSGGSTGATAFDTSGVQVETVTMPTSNMDIPVTHEADIVVTESLQSSQTDRVAQESAMDICSQGSSVESQVAGTESCVNSQETSERTPISSVANDTASVHRPRSVVDMSRLQDSVVTAVQTQLTARQQHLDSELSLVLHWLKEQPPLSEEQLRSLCITMDDFECALKSVQPSAKREGFATIPDVTWDDIGALHDVREELEMAILAPVKHPEQFSALGLTNPPGVLLAGPPGCGKTLLAKAIANESGVNFISVKGPELLNMYVGESERAVRQVFQRARNSSPCVVFFDELDALCPRRSGSGEGGSTVRVVNQLLTEMDGLEARKQVFIMGATNRPDIIDPAILRPGRLDKTLYVGLPSAADRWDILKTITKNGTQPRLSPDVSLKAVAEAEACEGYTGADMAALVREAAVLALREFMAGATDDHVKVYSSHFDAALKKIKPSVSQKDQLVYDKMRKRVTAS